MHIYLHISKQSCQIQSMFVCTMVNCFHFPPLSYLQSTRFCHPVLESSVHQNYDCIKIVPFINFFVFIKVRSKQAQTKKLVYTSLIQSFFPRRMIYSSFPFRLTLIDQLALLVTPFLKVLFHFLARGFFWQSISIKTKIAHSKNDLQ